MARVNFRDIRDRFTHIDADFVRSKCNFNDGPFEYVVRFYPYWEHPLFINAVKENKPWGFRNTYEGKKEVTVYPINPTEFEMSYKHKHVQVVDWAFCEDHPILWPYEDSRMIMCNGPCNHVDIIDALVDLGLPHITRRILTKYLQPEERYSPPYSLGYFPYSLFAHVKKILEEMKVPVRIYSEPECRKTPIAFFAEGDLIIAEDFEVEIPDFEHNNEWLAPKMAES